MLKKIAKKGLQASGFEPRQAKHLAFKSTDLSILLCADTFALAEHLALIGYP